MRLTRAQWDARLSPDLDKSLIAFEPA